GQLDFIMDTWMSPNHRAYVAVGIHLEHEVQPLSMILDIVEVAKSHKGVNLAQVFAMILQDFGISEKILSITADNAPSNNMLVAELVDLVAHFGGETSRTCCFLHIVNLIVKSLICECDSPKTKGLGDDIISSTDNKLDELTKDLDLEDSLT
ncbi:hypothetical protein PAXRUDRAFT_166731, partial [Paxillus rubicundulus Ve08.2h10]